MESRLKSSFTELLRVEGINFKGFGILPKYVMLDVNLSIEAKGIYAYLCSYAGNGSTSFPSRDTILRELGMGKDAYYNHFRQLTVQGYINVHQEIKSGLKKRNIYTIVSNPTKFNEDCTKTNCIKFTGMKAAGYGIIPKAIMTDPRLPIKAKGIYAYFCAFTGAGNSAFPKRDMILYHLGITEPTYYKFYKQLVALNYITVIQRHMNGKLGVNDYYLNDMPDVSKSTAKIISTQDIKNPDAVEQDIKTSDTVVQDLKNQDLKNQDLKNQDFVEQDLKNQDFVNPDTNINNLKTNNLNINTPSLILVERGEKREDIKNQVIKKIKDNHYLPYEYADDERYMEEAIHYLTSWDVLHQGYGDELRQRIYDLFNEALIQMCCSSSGDRIRLKNGYVTYVQVIDKINSKAKYGKHGVDIGDFLEVAIENYYNATMQREIKSPLKYMQACIWDALLTGNIELFAHFRRNF